MNKEHEGCDAALLRRIAEDAIEDLLSTPREIREQEVRENHGECSAVAARTRAMIGDAIAQHGKRRAAELRHQMEQGRSAERPRLRPMSVEEKRELYLRVANCNADLTMAARDGREVADKDLDGHLEAWLGLGVIDEDGNLR